ncbi:hypothetical protein [Methylobacterium nodulans]|uniref:Rho termination factor N-terminal domain-containing protein n=1 Tax=Methylobacterium nodulans (strain LMG 21967 / CNCM I-2342 / ORS 2060) TaxID=460265 RepID=B8ISC5_METNO|nr:hypothetical protein [Methylobacterium nodulans]ACL58765.1 hypothetical protein Mnod_3865 [Methylobacterium nodulans ORS 2060]
MRLREKGKPDGAIVALDWDAAQAALLAGTHVSAEGGEGERRPDQPAESGDLDARPQPELEALAAERGVDISGAKTKADVIAALRTQP